MSSKKTTKYNKVVCSQLSRDKLDKSIKDRQSDRESLPSRQFNCPSCAQVEKSSCSIPVWFTQPCDGV